jgi:hypothetical protein
MTAMATTLTKKPLGSLKPDPGNPRQPLALEELQELAASLMQRQHIPLLVKPDGTILDGYRRWSATLAGESRDQLERRGRKLKSSEASAVKVNRLTIPLGGGRSVIVAGSNLTLDDALAMLQETMKSGRKALAENLDGKTWAQVMKKKAKA